VKLTCAQPQIEAQVLAAVICDPNRLEQAPNLEIGDFADWRNQAVFSAIRNIQTAGETVNVIAIADEIEAVDMDHETTISTKAGAAYIGLLIVMTDKYLNDEHFYADLRHLRAVAIGRRP
jgi:replicative DNA helicase